MLRQTLIAIGAVLTLSMLTASDVDAGKRANRAKREFNKAQQAAQLGHFEEAIAAYEKAYELKPLPALLFNIGKCHHHLKNYDKAIYFIENFLSSNPSADERNTAQKELEAVRTAIAEDQPAALEATTQATDGGPTKGSTQPATASSGDPDAGAAGSAGKDSTTPAAMTAVTPPTMGEQESSEPMWSQWWFWTAVGGVVVAGVTATVLLASPDQEIVPPFGSLGTVDLTQ